MPEKFRTREHYGEAFWRKHHEAWHQSALNQREYREAHEIPLKAFGNWRAKFKPSHSRRSANCSTRRGLSHTLSHRPSHTLSHMTNDLPGPIMPPAREGCRRTFSEADKRRIDRGDGAAGSQPVGGSAQLWDCGACLFRWKLELTQAAPLFVAAEITDAIPQRRSTHHDA